MKKRSKLRVSLVAACVLAGLLGMAAPPATADTGDITIAGLKVNGVTPIFDTGISPTCARVGSGPGVSSNAHWGNVPHEYDVAADDPGATDCFHDISEFLKYMALHETAFSAIAPQQLRSALFSGTVNLSRPYEVFLDNIYITTTILATLSTTGTARGIGSCQYRDYLLLLACKDDTLSSVLARDDWGNPIKDWAGHYVYVNLQGILSQGGGTTYGNVFVLNTDVDPNFTWDDRVEHHEQVHSQQWSQYNWDFGRRYLEDLFNSQGNANYNYMLYGGPVKAPAPCYQQYERAAGLQDGRYAFRDEAHGGLAVGETGHNMRYVAPGAAWPTGWTTAINDYGPNDDIPAGKWLKCPSNFQPT